MNAARNMMARRHGFSPTQHVFGCELRLPGIAVTNEGYLNGTSEYHPTDQCMRSMEMRLAARRAMVNLDNADKVKRALEHRSRPLPEFEIGQFVYYWRVSKETTKQGTWKGPARVIGKIDSSKLWIAHGNKMLRCTPIQLRKMTEEQEAAIKFIPPEALRPAGRGANRGAQVFEDITKEQPPEMKDEPMPDVNQPGGPATEHQIIDDDDDYVEQHLERQYEDLPDHGEIDEETTHTGEASGSGEVAEPEGGDATMEGNEETTPPASSEPAPTGGVSGGTERTLQGEYGPIRHPRNVRHEPADLEGAMRRSLDLLDLGDVRAKRTEMVTDRSLFDEDDEILVTEEAQTTEEIKMSSQRRSEHFESFIAQDKKHAELKDRDLQGSEDQERVRKGKMSEWDKMLKSGAIVVHTGKDAEEIMRNTDPKRIIKSRFLKTKKERENGEDYDIKCRWVIKGYQDPDLDSLERQSPTLTADGLSVVLQLISSKTWIMEIADVEGAFLQGGTLTRERGKLFARIPKDGIPGVEDTAIIELTKCVYGLNDAPLHWWKSICKTLKQCGMKQSELDPCCFYYFYDKQLCGAVSLHVDDMLLGGDSHFQQHVVSKLKKTYSILSNIGSKARVNFWDDI